MSEETAILYVILLFILAGGIFIAIVALIGLFKKWKEEGFKRTFTKGRLERSMLPGLFDQPKEETETQTATRKRVPSVASQSKPEKSISKSVCSRCGAEAEWKFAISDQLACSKCFSKNGVCQGCGKKFSSDAALIKIGARKSCKSCQPYFERQLRRIDRKIDDFIRRGPFKS